MLRYVAVLFWGLYATFGWEDESHVRKDGFRRVREGERKASRPTLSSSDGSTI